MTARYFTTERFFTGFSSNHMVSDEPVFRTDDFTAEECKVLATSVQKELDELNRLTDEELQFDLAPSADEDLVGFIGLKTKWAIHGGAIEEEYAKPGGGWRYDMHRLYEIANEHAEIIRDLKRHSFPAAYLQCQLPSGEFSTFARIGGIAERELAVLIKVLGTELNRIGTELRVVNEWHAANEPHEYVQARLDYENFSQANEPDGSDYEYELAAENAFDRCVAEINRLRLLPSDGSAKPPDSDKSSPPVVKAKTASEELRASYRDPDNYWRNVWLYELRRSGKGNPAILTELAARATDFAPLESENALRRAIDAIASHHSWPLVKGKTGRPKASESDGEDGAADD